MTINKTVNRVIPPSSATDNALTRFDGITGRLVQDSLATLDDLGRINSTNINAILHNGIEINVDPNLGSDITGTGSIAKPLANIEAAVALCTNPAVNYIIKCSGGFHGAGEIIVLPNVGNVSFKGAGGNATQINKVFQLTAAATGISFAFTDLSLNAPIELNLNLATFYLIFFANGSYGITRTDTNPQGAVNVYNSGIAAADITGNLLVVGSIFIGTLVVRTGGLISMQATTCGNSPTLEGTGTIIAQCSIVTGTVTGTTIGPDTPQLRVDSSSLVIPPTLVNVTLVLLDNAQYHAFTPAVAGNWLVAPTETNDALDELAARAVAASRTLATDTTSNANVAPAEDTLTTTNIPANTLNVNGKALSMKAFGTTAANGNTKQIRAYFGATLLFNSGAIVLNDEDWSLELDIIRVGVGSQKIIGKFLTSNNLMAPITVYSTAAEDETTILAIRCSGEAASNADIVQEGVKIALDS